MHYIFKSTFTFLTLLCFLLIAGCNNPKPPENTDEAIPDEPKVERDLNEIEEEGTLRAITIFSPTSYFLYRGRPLGFEYELLGRLAAHLELKLEIVVAGNMDSLFAMLNRGEGDIIAYGMTITEPRQEIVNFTHHHFESQQVLVQRKPRKWRKMKLHEIDRELITNPLDLIGEKVHVRKNSSYYERLVNLQQEIGGEIIIEPISGDITTDEIIKMVVDGEIDYTVADNNIAAVNKTYFPILNIDTRVSFPQRIAWAVRKNSPKLLRAVNKWIDGMKKETDYYVIYNKYFKNKKLYRKRIRSEFHSETGNRISKYDVLVKKYAGNIGWDWRFLSSLIYQESKFDPGAKSWAGGKGLMQLMPATAKELGVKKRTDPEENLQGGVKYLEQIWGRWDDIPDSIQRVKFTLASYNCGYQHVRDAQRLAEKKGADPLTWDGEVEDYLLKLTYPRFYNDKVVKYGYVRGIEPYQYVREIFERFEHYKRFIEA